MHGGDGALDYTVGGSLNDFIYADDSWSTNNANSDVVFGDHAETMFHGHESHERQQATTTDAACNSGGSDLITLGPGDDLVS